MLERSFNTTIKLRRESPTDLEMQSIPLMELSSLAEAEDIHAKTREALQNMELSSLAEDTRAKTREASPNTDLDMR